MKEIHLPDKLIDELEKLVLDVERYLLDKGNIVYFNIDPNQLHENQLSGLNNERLNQVKDKSGVYAIWTKDETASTFHYIGHTAGPTARTRLKNHFFQKDPRTGSQLDRIKQAVKNGHEVGFTFVALDPPLIRSYVESELIMRYSGRCDWNIHSKGGKQKSTMADPLLE